MSELVIRKIRPEDKKYFARWWRDKELLKLTSGNLNVVTDSEVDEYFNSILENKNDYHFMIVINDITIGHVSLSKRQDSWYETQIVIGNSEYLSKGHGAESIRLLLEKARTLGISKIYLEVRPDNARAIKSYKKCGFRVVKLIKYDDEYLPETLRMELVTAESHNFHHR